MKLTTLILLALAAVSGLTMHFMAQAPTQAGPPVVPASAEKAADSEAAKAPAQQPTPRPLRPAVPASEEVMRRAMQMLDNIGATGPRPAAEFAKGLAEYREGKFSLAAGRLEQTVDSLTNSNQAAQARLILAMADHKLGRPDGTPIPSESQLSLGGGDWYEQTTTGLFAREARGVLVQ